MYQCFLTQNYSDNDPSKPAWATGAVMDRAAELKQRQLLWKSKLKKYNRYLTLVCSCQFITFILILRSTSKR